LALKETLLTAKLKVWSETNTNIITLFQHGNKQQFIAGLL